MDYNDLPDELLMNILSYIPYCQLKFNYHPGLVNKNWLNNFRQINCPCDVRYILYERKYCIMHFSDKYYLNFYGQKVLK